MMEAVERYRGKPNEEQQLVLMSAQLKLQRGNPDGALKALQAVKPGEWNPDQKGTEGARTRTKTEHFADQPNYRAARIKMAQIYLETKHDKHRFALCYRCLIEPSGIP